MGWAIFLFLVDWSKDNFLEKISNGEIPEKKASVAYKRGRLKPISFLAKLRLHQSRVELPESTNVDNY